MNSYDVQMKVNGIAKKCRQVASGMNDAYVKALDILAKKGDHITDIRIETI